MHFPATSLCMQASVHKPHSSRPHKANYRVCRGALTTWRRSLAPPLPERGQACQALQQQGLWECADQYLMRLCLLPGQDLAMLQRCPSSDPNRGHGTTLHRYSWLDTVCSIATRTVRWPACQSQVGPLKVSSTHKGHLECLPRQQISWAWHSAAYSVKWERRKMDNANHFAG